MSLDSFDPEQLFVRGVVTGELAGYLSGREGLIADVANRLAASDQSCLVYGERGVGKSTVAKQVSSVLGGTNPVFDKATTLDYGREKDFRPCLARVTEGWQTVGDLLLECVTAEDGPDTFVGRYSEALTSEDFTTEFAAKFGFTLAKVLSGEISRKVNRKNPVKDAQEDKELQTLERTKVRIFQRFVSRARSVDPATDPKIIFFVDEMDRSPKLAGLGNALKDLNDVQFCFIGIASTLDEIINDHDSAGRKLTGGDFRVKELTNDEILWIFDNATEISSDLVTFTTAFRDRVIEYSEGMPWIAQHVGYEAVFARLAPARRAGAKSLVIGIEDFAPAMRAAIEFYRATFNERYSIEPVLEDRGPTGIEVLKAVLGTRQAMTEEQIKGAFPPEHSRLKRWVAKARESFEGSGVLTRHGDAFAFPNALLRIFTRYHVEEVERLMS